METPLTTWEAKERAGLLALETDEWREKRMVASDPNTTAKVLHHLADAVYLSYCRSANDYVPYLLVEAVAAHPNTSPHDLIDLVCYPNEYITFFRRGFSLNPIAPLLCLEMPHFWENNREMAVREVLGYEYLPLPVISQLTHHSDKLAAEGAQLHVLLAGAVQTLNQFRAVIQAYLDAEKYAEYSVMPFSINLRRPSGLDLLYKHLMGNSYWLHHLNAAFLLPLSDTPFSSDPWNRSPLDLMHHLAHNGNRLVRWAAQTRLADPGFVFTWHEDNE